MPGDHRGGRSAGPCRPPRLDVQRSLLLPGAGRPRAAGAAGERLCDLTSGSTGVPKGVEVSHAAAIIPSTRCSTCCGWTLRTCCRSPRWTDLSVFDLFGGLGAGASLVLPPRYGACDAAAWAEAIQRHAVSLWNSAPALLEMALSLPASQADYRSLRAVLSGDCGPWTYPAACARVAAGRLPPACAAVRYRSGHLVEPAERRYGAAAPALDSLRPAIAGTGLPGGRRPRARRRDLVVGELWIGGASLACGYRNDPELSARRFVHDAQAAGIAPAIAASTGTTAPWNSSAGSTSR
ncbi:AMP-binding protein [Pseudomonas aeruginosa]|nr:AMP-binding protein [Pseudomonas aeruginosa]